MTHDAEYIQQNGLIARSGLHYRPRHEIVCDMSCILRGVRFKNQDGIPARLTSAAFPDRRRTLRRYYIETVMNVPDFRLLPRRKWYLRSSGMLYSAEWHFTDVSGQHIGPIFKGQSLPDLWRWYGRVVPKRRWEYTILRCVKSPEERRTNYLEYVYSRCSLNTCFLFFLALQTVLTGFPSRPSSVSVCGLPFLRPRLHQIRRAAAPDGFCKQY
jgi:hypothetical protein